MPALGLVEPTIMMDDCHRPTVCNDPKAWGDAGFAPGSWGVRYAAHQKLTRKEQDIALQGTPVRAGGIELEASPEIAKLQQLTSLLRTRADVLRDDFVLVDSWTVVSRIASSWTAIPSELKPHLGPWAIDLFWAVLKPGWFFEESDENVSSDRIPVTDDLQPIFLKRLAAIEQWAAFHAQLQDVPERDDVDASLRVSVCAHIAGARGVALLREHHADYEDVRDCLARAFHATTLLDRAWGADLREQTFGASIRGVRAITALELARMARREGKYAEALHRTAICVHCLREALWDAEGSWGQALDEWSFDITAAEVGSTISETLKDFRTEDWKGVAQDCCPWPT